MANKKKSPTANVIQQAFFDEVVSQRQVVEPQRKDKVYDLPTDIGLNGDQKDFATYIENINKLPSLKQMEDKDIIKFLYNHYEHVLSRITQDDMKFNTLRINDFLVMQKCDDGICACARLKIGVKIPVTTPWLKRFMFGAHLYWCPPPRHFHDASNFIKSIRQRYDNLKILYNEYFPT